MSIVCGSHRRLKNRGQVGDLFTLSQHDDELAHILQAFHSRHFWQVPAHIRAVTRALSKRDFGLQLSLHPDRLFPTLSSRLNYVLCVQDLVLSTCLSLGTWFSQGLRLEPPLVLDVGTGCSAVHALLAAREGGWASVATDIDELNLSTADSNVRQNELSSSICIVDARGGAVGTDMPILPFVMRAGLKLPAVVKDAGKTARLEPSAASASGDTGHAVSGAWVPPTGAAMSLPKSAMEHSDHVVTQLWAAFCNSVPSCYSADDEGIAMGRSFSPLFSAVVCNPPFFSSLEEARSSSSGYERSSCTGAPVELVYAPAGHRGSMSSSGAGEGGEVAFVSRMIRESFGVSVRSESLWFTTMLGKASSIESLLPLLRSVGAPLVRVGQLYQGRTARWMLAWSWLNPEHVRHEAWQYEEVETGVTGIARGQEQVGLTSRNIRPEHEQPVSKRQRLAEPGGEGLTNPYLTNAAHDEGGDWHEGGAAPSLTGPQRSCEQLRAVRAFAIQIDKTTSTNLEKVRAHSIVCGTQTFIAVPSAADCGHLRAIAEPVACSGNSANPATISPVPFLEISERVAQSLASRDRSGAADDGLAFATLPLSNSEESDVNLCVQGAGLQGWLCATAWACACLRLPPRCGPTPSLETAGSAAKVLFRFEVQVLVPLDVGERSSAIVCACLLGPSTSAASDSASSACGWQAFERMSDRLDRDVRRSGRKWRRALSQDSVAKVVHAI